MSTPSYTSSPPRHSIDTFRVTSPIDTFTSSIATSESTSSSFDGKRQSKNKENVFLYKHGQRHHAYDSEKAPYPVSYVRDVLELEALDNRLMMCINNSLSFVDFKDGPPTRSLDLGCGSGNWVMEAVKEWPNCRVVGFDLVNVQIPLKILDPSIAERVTWMHGNFLTTKLPFEDDAFDFVHVKDIARGVPENKWGVLFEEINRVLQPGGVVEVLEEDILFPHLPRSFTAPLRARTQRSTSVHFPDNFHPTNISPPTTPPDNMPPHDHALLESLYQSVFESRFINLQPTAVIPVYFTIYFRQVVLGPAIHIPMPPLPPLQPLPKEIVSSYDTTEILDAASTISFSSVISGLTSTSVDSIASSILFNESETSYENTYDPTCPLESLVDFGLPHKDEKPVPQASIPESMQEAPVEINTLSERPVAMHLYRLLQNILGCQEAMWEELKDRLRNKTEELKPYGWDDDEELEELESRKKFERLVDRFRGDMEARTSLWYSLSGLGWPLPPREPLSKAELIEEERIHQGMLAARQFAFEDDDLCRTGRVFVGYKSL